MDAPRASLHKGEYFSMGRGKGRETLPGLRGRKGLRIGGPASTRPEAMLASADICVYIDDGSFRLRSHFGSSR